MLEINKSSGALRRIATLLAVTVVLMATSHAAGAQSPLPPTLKVVPANGESPTATVANGTGFTGFGAATFTIDGEFSPIGGHLSLPPPKQPHQQPWIGADGREHRVARALLVVGA